MGPTATGKTDLALRIADRFPCDIISVDSALVYRGMDIGTAKPPQEILSRYPHRLIDIRDPSESYSAADFRHDALAEIERSHRAGRIPLLVGGTMLYFRALQYGLSRLPAADPAVRARLDAQAARDGWDVMHHQLASVDPVAAQRIHPNDPQRIQRALEVYRLTGRPLSALCSADELADPFPFRAVKLILWMENRKQLRERIRTRFSAMLDAGLIAEVWRLYERSDLHSGLPAIRAVGYRQVWDYLGGLTDYTGMVERAIIATGQLAKRQMTWLRRESDATRFDYLTANLADQILKSLENALK